MSRLSHTKILRPDAKGRVTLKSLMPCEISSFRAHLDKKNRIILEPFAEIPAAEKWLFDNPKALAKVMSGIKESAKGELHDLGRFSQYQDDHD